MRRWTGVLMAVILAALCVGCGDTIPPTPTGSVSGYVYVPIGGAARSANAPAGYMALEGAAVTIGGASTSTDENGYYILPAVPMGEQVLIITKSGYATITKTVTVKKDETTVATARDSAESVVTLSSSGSISVTSSPASATIYVDSVSTGLVTPQTLLGISAGAHTVYVSLDGYVPPATQTVTVSSGQESSATFTLTAFACFKDSDCDDGQSLTLDSCANPGVAGASCAHTAIACNTSADCKSPTPVCINGGGAGSACIACSVSADCGEAPAHLYYNCANPGTTSSSCVENMCIPRCLTNFDCNDNNTMTLDTCLTSSCETMCYHAAIACTTDADCTDWNNNTRDTCVNGGTLSAACQFTACSAVCSGDLDCNPAGGGQIFAFCTNPGTCDAACVFNSSN